MAFLLFDRSITPRKRPSVFFGRVFFGLVSAGLLAGCSSSFPNAFEAQLADHLTETRPKKTRPKKTLGRLRGV
ncbi:MAG: hypothetical protein AAGJ69_10605, partial [Cyanobacteria bacterium J06559_1]